MLKKKNLEKKNSRKPIFCFCFYLYNKVDFLLKKKITFFFICARILNLSERQYIFFLLLYISDFDLIVLNKLISVDKTDGHE